MGFQKHIFHIVTPPEYIPFFCRKRDPSKCEKSAPLTDVRKSSVTKPNSCVKDDAMQDLMLPNKKISQKIKQKKQLQLQKLRIN